MPSNNVEQIKDRLTIEEVVGGYMKLEKAGKNLKARCPFHNEKTPSFFISPERGMYHCFGCGRGGDMFSFIEEYEGLDFSGALKTLADRAGVALSPLDPKIARERERLFILLEEATEFFITQLINNKSAQVYLLERGITEELREEFHLGYAPDEWRKLHETFIAKGYSEKELQSVGLIKRSENGSWYDTFRTRIIFPISDNAGRTIAFSGRLFPEKKSSEAPKYLNTPETIFFNKSEVLYPLWKSKQAIRRYDFSLVVEGQIDVLLAHREKYHNTVAPLGTALTRNHLERLKQLSTNILLAFDADTAGMTSFKKSSLSALQMGFDVKVVTIPTGSDPADMILENPEKWKNNVKSAQHAIDYLLDILQKDSNDNRSYKKLVSQNVLPLVAHISNKIDQAHFVKIVAETLSVPESAVYEELQKSTVDKNDAQLNEISVQKRTEEPREKILRELLGILVWQEGTKNSAIDTVDLRKKLKDMIDETTIETLLTTYNMEELLFEIEERFSVVPKLKRYIEEALMNLERILLEEQRFELGQQIKTAEKKDDNKEAEKVAQKKMSVAKRIDKITQKLQEVV